MTSFGTYVARAKTKSVMQINNGSNTNSQSTG